MSYETHQPGNKIIKLSGGKQAEVTIHGTGHEPVLWVPGTGHSPHSYPRLLRAMAERAPDKQFIAPFTAGTGSSSWLRRGESHVDRIGEVLHAMDVPDDDNVILMGNSSGGDFATQAAGLSERRRGISVAGPVFYRPGAIALGVALTIDEARNDIEGCAKDIRNLDFFGLGSRMLTTGLRRWNPYMIIGALGMYNHIDNLPLEPRRKLFEEDRGIAIYHQDDPAVHRPQGFVPEHWIEMIPGRHSGLLTRDPNENAAHLVGAMERVTLAPLVHAALEAAEAA